MSKNNTRMVPCVVLHFSYMPLLLPLTVGVFHRKEFIEAVPAQWFMRLVCIPPWSAKFNVPIHAYRTAHLPSINE